MNQLTSQEKLVYSKCRLYTHNKFFGLLLYSFPIETINPKSSLIYRIPTLATDGKKIFCNLDFFDKLTKNEASGVILHELLHILLKHFYRFDIATTSSINKMLLNMALDYAINSIIVDDINNNAIVDLPKGCMYDVEFKGMNAEKILEILQKEMKENRKKIAQRLGYEDFEEISVEGFGSGEGNGDKKNTLDDHNSSFKNTKKQIEDTKNKTGKNITEQMNEINRKIAEISETVKNRGLVPDEINRMLDEYFENLKGYIDWKKYIKNLITSLGRDQYTTKKFNKYYMSDNWYFPGIIGSKAKAICAYDLSGSIGTVELKQFIGEVDNLLKRMRGVEITLYGIDCEIQGKTVIKRKSMFKSKASKVLKGGGGTAFLPIFQDILKNPDRNLKTLFFFTDGYGDQECSEFINIKKEMEKRNIKTYWILPKSSKDITFPFGEKVIMKN